MAEGYNNTIKTAFRSYGYFRPENARMYMSEFTLMLSKLCFSDDQVADPKKELFLFSEAEPEEEEE